MMKYVPSLLLIAGLAVPAVAQQPAVAADGPGGRPTSGRAMGRPGGERPDPAAMRRREADDLALVLGLSAAQRPALDAFLTAQMPPRRPDGPPSGEAALGFEQRLGAMQAAVRARGAEEQARIEALQRFYGQLDARQKSVFEALMRLRHGPGGPGGHGPEGPGGDGPGGPERMPG
jgi:hypothetical protein